MIEPPITMRKRLTLNTDILIRTTIVGHPRKICPKRKISGLQLGFEWKEPFCIQILLFGRL
jgi:hypothetical protein